MVEKIKTELKTKHSNLGLSDETMTGVANILAATGVITEENIATVVDGLKPEYLKSIQSDADKARTEAARWKKKAEDASKQTEPNPKPQPPAPIIEGEPKDEVSKKLEEMEKKLAEMEKRERESQLWKTVFANDKVKGLNADLVMKVSRLVTIEETDTTETLVAKLEAEYNDFSAFVTPGAGNPNAASQSSHADTSMADYIARKRTEGVASDTAQEIANAMLDQAKQ